METVKMVILRVLCAPLYVGMLISLVFFALFGEKKEMVNGVLVTTMKADSWPVRTWFKNWGGFCAGYGIVLSSNHNDLTLKHELVHTKQLEDHVVVGLMNGVVFAIALGAMGAGAFSLIPLFCLWCLSPIVNYLMGGATSLLRGGQFYRNNLAEESARGVAGQTV